ncbi:MAG: aspartate/glutamate racemase family protein [Chloroflexota bacterium]|nr:aspartate/glutamate racemase family protein [Chloroflexota bacterium]
MDIDIDKRKFQRWGEDPGWRGFVGFIGVPNLCLSGWEFMKIAPEGFIITFQHTYMTRNGVPSKFDFTVEGIQEAAKQVEHCADVLKAVGVDLIAQSGTPYSFCPEGGLAATRELHARVEKKTGLPAVFMGLAVIAALKKMGAKSIAVSSTYYYEGWRKRYTDFLQEAGFNVLGNESFVRLGYYANDDEVRRHPTRRFAMSLIYRAAKKVADMYPQADCVVISGAGSLTLDILQPLETDLRKPVISSGASQYYEIFRRLNCWESIPGRGSLLASLSNGP